MSTLTLDSVIHAPVRLQIMATLIACVPDHRMEFTQLRKLLRLTDGNLGTHLGTLEHAGYVAIEKDFAGKRPRTRATATSRGRQAYVDHVTALRAILDRPFRDTIHAHAAASANGGQMVASALASNGGHGGLGRKPNGNGEVSTSRNSVYERAG